MCKFLSGYISHDGRTVYPGDLRNHDIAEDVHGLTEMLHSDKPPVPFEWVGEEADALTVRMPDGCRHDEGWYKERLLGRWSSRMALVMWAIPRVAASVECLDLNSCTGLKALPDGLTVGGSLDLNSCTGLKALPDGLTVGGSLYLSGCTDLKALSDGLTVGVSLYLNGCTGLKTLPDGLTVGGWLDLSGCTGLKMLPDGLSISGSLDLCGCTGLKALPDGLTVGGWLNLSGCAGLTKLPDNMSVKKTSLPRWMQKTEVARIGICRRKNI